MMTENARPRTLGSQRLESLILAGPPRSSTPTFCGELAWVCQPLGLGVTFTRHRRGQTSEDRNGSDRGSRPSRTDWKRDPFGPCLDLRLTLGDSRVDALRPGARVPQENGLQRKISNLGLSGTLRDACNPLEVGG